MKTQIITIFTALVLVTGIAKANAAAAPADNGTYTVVTDISAINKIEVRGNVELYISDGASDQVKVYNKYYGENALVQSKNGVLRITSYKAEKLVVWVTASDLRSISAYDNADVSSFGDLSKIEFNVDLYNSSSAKLKFDAFSATISVNDQAKVNLSGSANDYTLKYNNASNVNQTGFVAVNESKTQTVKVSAKKPALSEIDELANL